MGVVGIVSAREDAELLALSQKALSRRGSWQGETGIHVLYSQGRGRNGRRSGCPCLFATHRLRCFSLSHVTLLGVQITMREGV